MAVIQCLLVSVGILLAVSIVAGLNCNGKLDVVIAVPGSPEQVPQEQFDRLEDFLIDLVNYYEISSTQTNVGLILYGKNPEIITPLNPALDKRDINTRISVLAQRHLYRNINGGQDVTKAMDAIMQLHSNTQRPGTPKVGIILTYGAADLSGSTSEEVAQNLDAAAQQAKTAGINMFAVSTNTSVPGFSTLTAGDYCRLFSLGNYKGLPSLLPYIASSTCYIIDDAVSPPSGDCFPVIKPSRPQSNVMTCPPPYSGIFPDPTNCAYFIQCTKTGRVRTKCAPGTLFDSNILRCNHREFVPCWNKLDCPRGYGLFPHPKYCNKYINCYQGVPRVQSCPAGLVYNSVPGFCDYPGQVSCGDKEIGQ